MFKSKSLGMITKSTSPTANNMAYSPEEHASRSSLSPAYNANPLLVSSSQSLLLTSSSPRDSLGVLPIEVYDSIDAGAPMPSLEREVQESVVSAGNKPDLAAYDLPLITEEEDDEEARPTLRPY